MKEESNILDTPFPKWMDISNEQVQKFIFFSNPIMYIYALFIFTILGYIILYLLLEKLIRIIKRWLSAEILILCHRVIYLMMLWNKAKEVTIRRKHKKENWILKLSKEEQK